MTQPQTTMNVTFPGAISLFFKKYTVFNGRSTRAEYWWAELFILIVSIGLSVVDGIIGSDILGVLFSLAIFVPSIALTVRRYHDIGRSGWWYLSLIGASLFGTIIIVYSLWPVFSDLIEGVKSISINFVFAGPHALLLIFGVLLLAASGIINFIFTILPSGPDNNYGSNPYNA